MKNTILLLMLAIFLTIPLSSLPQKSEEDCITVLDDFDSSDRYEDELSHGNQMMKNHMAQYSDTLVERVHVGSYSPQADLFLLELLNAKCNVISISITFLWVFTQLNQQDIKLGTDKTLFISVGNHAVPPLEFQPIDRSFVTPILKNLPAKVVLVAGHEDYASRSCEFIVNWFYMDKKDCVTVAIDLEGKPVEDSSGATILAALEHVYALQ